MTPGERPKKPCPLEKGHDAIVRALQASDIIGSQAILTHAKDEKAKAFYSKFGFEPST